VPALRGRLAVIKRTGSSSSDGVTAAVTIITPFYVLRLVPRCVAVLRAVAKIRVRLLRVAVVPFSAPFPSSASILFIVLFLVAVLLFCLRLLLFV